MPSLPPAIDLNVRSDGEGTLVLGLHDLFGDGSSMMDALRPLATRGYHVVTPDLRGHGQSPTPRGPWSVDDIASDIARIVSLDGGPAIIVGQGLGAVVALALTLGHPSLVSGLVLSGMGPRAEDAEGQERWLKVSRALNERGAEGPAYAAEAIANRPDWRGALAQVVPPAVVVAGADDRRTPVAAQRELSIWLRRARFQTVKGGHELTVDAPGAFLAAVEYLATSGDSAVAA